MAKMKLEFTAQRATTRGLSILQDRLIARLPDIAPLASRLPWLFNLRDRAAGRRRAERDAGSACRHAARLPRWRRDTFQAAAPTLALATRDHVLAAARWRAMSPARRWCSSSTPSTATSRPKTPSTRVRVLQAAGYAVHVATRPDGGALCCGRTLLAAGLADAGQGTRARAARRAAAAGRRRAEHRRPGAFVPADDARRDARDGPGRGRRAAGRPGAAARGVPGARGQGRPLPAAPAAGHAADARARPLPPEGLRRDAAGARGAAPDSRRRSRS